MDKKKLASSHDPKWKIPLSDSPSPYDTSIDEAPEFHDPYSDLNLFLSRKVKEEIVSSGNSKKWSLYVQDKLIEKIGREFQAKFPGYRLGVSALKKIWEKVAYFSQVFENQKEALTEEGKLDTSYLIRENLKQFLGTKRRFSFHPYLLAQQLALKISECLAAYDGIRPVLQHITKTIWATQRHLIPPAQVPEGANPYDEFDKWDKVIVKTMLEASGKNSLTQEELHAAVRDAIRSLKDLPHISHDSLAASISALLAQKLYSRAPFHSHIPANQKRSLSFFLQNHLALYKNWTGTFAELVLRLKALYSQACQKEGELPFLTTQDLEIVIWKMVAEQQKLLEIFPQPILQRIEEEIGYIFIDNPNQTFRAAVDIAVQFFKNVKELAVTTNWVEIEHKIALWTLQGDLVYRSLQIENNHLLNFIRSGADSYLRLHPFLTHFTHQLDARIKILERYAWYAGAPPEQSTVERFFEWHLHHGATIEQIEKICKEQLPLLPFERSLLSKYEKTSKKDEGDAE